MTTIGAFMGEIRGRDGALAPGSESAAWGYFVDRMLELSGGGQTALQDSDTVLTADELAWWRRAYDLLEADAAKPEVARASDMQEIFDAV